MHLQRSPQFLKSRLSSCIHLVFAACIRHYSPRLGRHTRPDLAVRSENLTPPRISPGCPHCVIPVWPGLWLGRGTIVGRIRSWRGYLPQYPLGRMGTARHLVCRFDRVQNKRLFLLGFFAPSSAGGSWRIRARSLFPSGLIRCCYLAAGYSLFKVRRQFFSGLVLL